MVSTVTTTELIVSESEHAKWKFMPDFYRTDGVHNPASLSIDALGSRWTRAWSGSSQTLRCVSPDVGPSRPINSTRNVGLRFKPTLLAILAIYADDPKHTRLERTLPLRMVQRSWGAIALMRRAPYQDRLRNASLDGRMPVVDIAGSLA